jgi:hypothetical protein
MNFAEAERALDAGTLEMQRPWGDWVPVRRAGSTKLQAKANYKPWRYVEVWMEAEVISAISEAWDRFNQPHIRERKSHGKGQA